MDNSSEYNEDIPKYIEEHGLSGIEEVFKAKLEDWKDVEVQIGVTGNSGVGKVKLYQRNTRVGKIKCL